MSLASLLRRRPASPTGGEVARPTVAERVVARTAGILSGDHSRRRFLARTAVVGSAIAVNPVTYLLKPEPAYGVVCGTCGDGWTAFCCTINNGKNSCPPNTFVAGWWKADGSAYCDGGARYIIDCNATCPTQCSCRCAGGGCDDRRTCCNQFRYGQCNQQISCYGPVACRVAICITPWTYDAACSTHTLTDNRTRDHGASCLRNEPNSAISRKYYALGGPDGFLGIMTQTERAHPAGGGRYAIYQGGRIYSTSAGAYEIHGSIYDVWATANGPSGAYGYPTSDVSTASNGIRYSRFQRGAIYRMPSSGATYGVPEPYYSVYQSFGGISASSALGLPTSHPIRSGDQRAVYIEFQRGRIYRRSVVTAALFGPIFAKHEELSGIYGPLGHAETSIGVMPDGRGRAAIFEHDGVIYHTATTGAHAVWGDLLGAYLAFGGPSSAGYPTTDRQAVGDGRGVTVHTERARIYSTSSTGAHVVPDPILATYLDAGGPGGSYGYPTGDVTFTDGGTRASQTFEGGTIAITSPNLAFVKAAYADFLGRGPTQSEVEQRVTAINEGRLSRAGLVRELGGSDEYVSRLVQRFYNDTLGRDGGPAEVAYWVDRLRSRRSTVAETAASFYASPEYYDGIGGGTDRSWIADLYDKILDRPASSGDLDYWAGEIAGRGRTRVALHFYQGQESRARRVRRLYLDLLGRQPSAADISYWGPRVAAEGDIALATTLAGMAEYFNRAQGRFPD